MNEPFVVAICGRAGSGKNEAAEVLQVNGAYVNLALADPIKVWCKSLFEIEIEKLWGPSQFRDQMTRKVLQTVGMLGREIDIQKWSKIAVDRIQIINAYGIDPISISENVGDNDGHFVVTDLRFQDELVCLQKNFPQTVSIKIERDCVGKSDHESESSVDRVYCDYVIKNNSTIEDLQDSVVAAVRDFKNLIRNS
jgi:hypothetical protein